MRKIDRIFGDHKGARNVFGGNSHFALRLRFAKKASGVAHLCGAVEVEDADDLFFFEKIAVIE